jgi:hypothetical protein
VIGLRHGKNIPYSSHPPYKLDFILGIAGFIAWGASMIGMVTNLWLGSAVLLVAFGFDSAIRKQWHFDYVWQSGVWQA